MDNLAIHHFETLIKPLDGAFPAVVQEGQPVVDAGPVGCLVGNVAYDHGFAGPTVFQYSSQRVVHGYALGLEALAQAEKQTVENLVFQGVVDLSASYGVREPQR